jgi:hypothetical protein
MRITLQKILVIAVLACGFAIGCSVGTKRSDVIFNIPQDFEGSVIIFYDQKEGVAPLFNGTEYIFDLPNDGIIKTSLDQESTTGKSKFFFVGGDRRTELELLYPTGPKYPAGFRSHDDISDDERDNKFFAVSFERGNYNIKNGNVKFNTFLVCKPKDGEYHHAQMQQKLYDALSIFPRS